MKSFLRNVVQRKEASGGGLVGRTVKVGAYTVRVEAHLADGGFASIYRVRDSSTGTAFALKHMRLMGDYEAIADCMREVNALKKLRDVPSVLTLRAAAFTGTKGNEQEAYLILDLCKDNLVEFMRDQEHKISTAKIVQIFSAICQAVAAMHRQQPPLAHRDLKAENVLQHNSGDWVLCDFGSVTDKPEVYESSDAVLMGEEVIRKYTTPAYRAPEMWDLYSRDRIDTKADIWALGCLLYYLMFGKLAFQAEAKLQILKGEISLPPTRPPPLVGLLKELIVTDPSRRPDILVVVRRLQEVADALNVDPALLVPKSQPAPPGVRTSRDHSLTPASRSSSLTKDSSDLAAARPPPALHRTSPATPAAPAVMQQPQQPASAAVVAPTPVSQPISQPPLQPSTSWRSNSLNRAFTPPSAGVQPAVSIEPEGFANFDDPAAFARPREEEAPFKAAASPPRSQRSLARPREPSFGGPEAAALGSEVASLKRQLADLQQQNQQLATTVKSQQATIKQLQVDNYNQVLQLKRLGLDPVLSIATRPPPAAAAPSSEAGWASFDSPPAEPVQAHGSLAHVRTPRNDSVELPPSGWGSPTKQRLSNGGNTRSHSPQASAAPSAGFDPFGIQPRLPSASDGVVSPSTDPNSGNGTPSETMSRQSALSAFAESLKQPALAGEAEAEPGSPLSGAPSHEAKAGRQRKRSHRRSNSEPVPLENVQLFEER